jgi:hypothetical protein
MKKILTVCAITLLIWCFALNTAVLSQDSPKEIQSPFLIKSGKAVKEIRARCANDATLKFLLNAEIALYEKENQGIVIGAVGIEAKTDDQWNDLPLKPQGYGTGTGVLSVRFRLNEEDPGWTPSAPREGRAMHRTVWRADIENALVVIYTFTSDLQAHARLCAIVREEAEKQGIRIKGKS